MLRGGVLLAPGVYMPSNKQALFLIKRLTSVGHSRVRALGRWLNRFFVVVLIVRTAKELSDDDAPHMAAGVAFYMLFSLFPLLLGLIALTSFFVEAEDIQGRFVDFTAEYLPGSEDVVSHNIDSVFRLRGALGIFAILGLLWSGSAVFGALTRAINRAWDVHRDRPIYISKPRQLLMALSVAVLFYLSMSAATLVRVAGRLEPPDVPGMDFVYEAAGRALLQGMSFLLILCIFLLVYKFTPNTKTYWRYIWPGAVVCAVLFEAAKSAFIVYVDRFANYENVYGSLTPVIALLVWTYVSSFILILGAELNSEYGRLRRGVERGVLLHSAGRSVGVRRDI